MTRSCSTFMGSFSPISYSLRTTVISVFSFSAASSGFTATQLLIMRSASSSRAHFRFSSVAFMDSK